MGPNEVPKASQMTSKIHSMRIFITINSAALIMVDKVKILCCHAIHKKGILKLKTVKKIVLWLATHGMPFFLIATICEYHEL